MTRVSQVHSLSGFLHGMTETTPPPLLITPLRPGIFRVGRFTPALYDRVVSLGARFQLVVSDGFGYGGQNGWPYEDFSRWEDYVRQLTAQVGDREVLWDIWNERDLGYFWYGSDDQFQETYKRAYSVLYERYGEKLKITAPSLAAFSADGIKAFLDFCLENGIKIDTLSWHELHQWLIPQIPHNVEQVRREILNNPKYEPLGIKHLQIGEYISKQDQFYPGEIVGYLSMMERADIESAVRACWSEKDNDKDSAGPLNCLFLDGLVSGVGDEQPTFQKRAVWWAYKFYADLGERRFSTQTSDERVVALAAPTSEGNAVLFGYYEDRVTPSKTTLKVSFSGLNEKLCVNGTAVLVPDQGTDPVSGPLPALPIEKMAPDKLLISNVPVHGAVMLKIGQKECER